MHNNSDVTCNNKIYSFLFATEILLLKIFLLILFYILFYCVKIELFIVFAQFRKVYA